MKILWIFFVNDYKKIEKVFKCQKFPKDSKSKSSNSKRNDIFSFEFYVLRFEFSLKRKILKLKKRQTIKNCCSYILECLQNFFFSKKKKKCGDRPNQQYAMTLMKIVSPLISKELWQRVMRNEDSTSVQSEQCTDFVHMRTTSHCISTDELSQFRRSRDTLSTVPPPPDHHWASPSSWLEASSRSQSKKAGRRLAASDDSPQVHEVSLPVHTTLFSFADWTRYPNRECQKTSQALSLLVDILAGPLLVEGLILDAILTPELGLVQEVIATCNQIEKLTPNTIVSSTPGLLLTHDGNAAQ